MKAVIVYESSHHGNTGKLVKAIEEKYCIDTMNIQEQDHIDLTQYDLIGFASGIAFGKFYKKILSFVKECLPEEKKVFFIYTCGKDSKDYCLSMSELAEQKNCQILGCYSCKGFDTYGPLKIIGGINKKHPNEDDITKAIKFVEQFI